MSQEIYNGFAQVYDLFMDNIPYEEVGKYLEGLLRKNGFVGGRIIELGCGTGTMLEVMRRDGITLCGVDFSARMLEEAAYKCPDAELVEADFREYVSGEPADAVFCVCDGLNYITEEEDLFRVFENARRSLKDSGVFVFDLKTEYFYREVLGDTTFADNRETASLIWENHFDPGTKIHDYLITVYSLEDPYDPEEHYLRTEELHHQKAYDPAEVITMLRKAGFTITGLYDAYTEDDPSQESERVYISALAAGG